MADQPRTRSFEGLCRSSTARTSSSQSGACEDPNREKLPPPLSAGEVRAEPSSEKPSQRAECIEMDEPPSTCCCSSSRRAPSERTTCIGVWNGEGDVLPAFGVSCDAVGGERKMRGPTGTLSLFAARLAECASFCQLLTTLALVDFCFVRSAPAPEPPLEGGGGCGGAAGVAGPTDDVAEQLLTLRKSVALSVSAESELVVELTLAVADCSAIAGAEMRLKKFMSVFMRFRKPTFLMDGGGRREDFNVCCDGCRPMLEATRSAEVSSSVSVSLLTSGGFTLHMRTENELVMCAM